MAIQQANTAMLQPPLFLSSDHTRPPVFCVDIPLLPESAVGSALQFIDLLRDANLLAGLRLGAQGPRLAWRLLDAECRPLPSLPGPLAAYTPAEGVASAGIAPAHAVFIPPLHTSDIQAIRAAADRYRPLSRRLGIALDAGQKLITVGNGAWLAAQCGRLSGRKASLPWFYIAGFQRDFPDIGHSIGQDLSDDGPWLSCALSQSVHLLAIAVVRQALGEELALVYETAVTPGHQRASTALQANAQQHIPHTRDSTLARAIAWMEEHLDQPYSLAQLAKAASVSTRTLLRHFQQEMSQSPLDHLHSLRCARARVMLEITLESVPSIAVACGYADPAAFRRIFARYTGLAPIEYRKRHALRAPRRRWRVDVK